MRPQASFPSPVPTAAPRGRKVALRLALALTVLALAGVSAFEHRVWRTEQRRLEDLLASAAPLALPERLAVEVERETDPARARLRAARGIFAAELSRRPPELPPGSPGALADARASGRRLEEAARLAAESFAVRPAAWEGPLVIGGAVYLGRLRTEDERLIRAYRDWEQPLLAARELAPGRFEPEVVLAHAYSRLWSVLSEEKRRFAFRLIRRGLADRYSRQDLLPAWLAAAGADRRLAFSAIPDDPEAWSEVRQLYSQVPDWAAMRDARVRFRRALKGRLATALDQARRQVRRGNVDGGRELYLDLIVRAGEADDGERLLPIAFDECPAGRADAATAARLGAALGWLLDRCGYAQCPIGPASLVRLARLSGEKDPTTAALAARLGGDLDLARSYEGQAGDAFGRRGGFELPSPQLLAALATEVWPESGWTMLEGRARRELVASRAARGIEVAIAEVATGGAVVEVRADGRFAGTYVAKAGTPLGLPLAVLPGRHLIEVVAINGGPVRPGAVRLLPPPG